VLYKQKIKIATVSVAYKGGFMKKLIIIVCLICCFIMNGCFNMFMPLNSKYKGDVPHLYTIAVNSLLWTWGYSVIPETETDPAIEILETDSFGRILFNYASLIPLSGCEGESAYLICHYYDDKYVYFYEDSYLYYGLKTTEPSEEEVNKAKDDLESLKQANDWNKPLDADKCVRKEIIREKPVIDASVQSIRSFYLEIVGDDAVEFNIPTDDDNYLDIVGKGRSGFMPSYITSDSNGKHLIVASGLRKTENPEEYGQSYFAVMVFNADWTYDNENYFIIETEEMFEYLDELKLFKKSVGWIG